MRELFRFDVTCDESKIQKTIASARSQTGREINTYKA